MVTYDKGAMERLSASQWETIGEIVGNGADDTHVSLQAPDSWAMFVTCSDGYACYVQPDGRIVDLDSMSASVGRMVQSGKRL